MKNYSIYNQQTGAIEKVISLQEDILDSPENTPYYIEGVFSGLTQYVDVESKTIVDMPASPGPGYLFDYYSKSWVIDENMANHTVETHRLNYLKDSDWIIIRALDMGEPIPVAWQIYRQALRDIDKQPGYPTQVVWPEQP
jgi:hypothetical protein